MSAIESAGPAPSQQMDNEEPLIIYLAIDFLNKKLHRARQAFSPHGGAKTIQLEGQKRLRHVTGAGGSFKRCIFKRVKSSRASQNTTII